MVHLLRAHPLRLGLCVLALGAVAMGTLAYRHSASDAYSHMPEDRRAYLSWLASIHRDAGQALQAGVDLLYEAPGLHLLYLRLAEICQEQEAQRDCRAALENVTPPSAQAALYRQAALNLLSEEPRDAAPWVEIARSPVLDPALARLVVDQVAGGEESDPLAEATDVWRKRLATDSSAAGAAFGLGYATGLRGDMDAARRLLVHASEVAPDDPHVYRELGRVYYHTGQPDAFKRVLRAGIDAAAARYDVEQALILRGNLGMGLMQRRGGVEEAEALFEEALRESRLLADPVTEGYNLYRLAGVRSKQHRFDEALALLDSADVRYAAHAPQDRLQVKALRGTVLTALFRFSDARRVLEDVVGEAAAQRNLGARIRASLALAQLYYRMGSYAAAREVGQEVLQDGQRYGLEDIEVAACIVLGDVERRLGNVEQAEAHYERGLELVDEDSPRQTELYVRLGRAALNMQDASAAEAYYAELVEHVQEREGPAARARVQEGLGWTYSQFGNYEQAEAYFDEAIAEYREAGDAQRLVSALLKKAWSLIERSDYARAERALAGATALTQSEGTSLAYLSRVEAAWGNLRLNQGRYRDALRHLARAQTTEDRHQRPLVQWHVLHAMALAYWGLGETAEAERYFRESIETIEDMRDNLDLREHRAAFVQGKIGAYKNFSAFLEEQGRSAEAFHYAERARSRSLADLLVTTLQGESASPESQEGQVLEIAQRRHALRAAVDDPERDLEAVEEADGLAEADLLQRRELQRVDSVYNEQVRRLPDSSMIKPLLLAQPLDASAAQEVLKEGEAMVVYDLRGDQEGTLPNALPSMTTSTAYVITKDAVTAHDLPVEEGSLAEMVRLFRDQISDSGTGPGVGWEAASRQLYDGLVAPIREALPASIEHLHLVPEGVLHYLPFAALQDEDGTFLVERFSLSVTPSASVLQICRSRNTDGLWRSILAVADPDGHLPGSRAEARAIASIPSVRARTLIGPEATQEAFEALAETWADIVHIATHGRFVSHAPWSSYLELHGDVLSADEIGHLRLNAYLVTLSACETALSGGYTSDVPPGDEWVGLNQAFLAAGTPTVMASLWPIDDTVSSDFMISFYEKLIDANGKSKALAQVQRKALRSAEAGHPFYWAAFTVIGDPL